MLTHPADAEALTFDCYGTLIDWERGILDALRPWAKRQGLALSDEALLAKFAEAESAAEEAAPGALYSEILREVQHRMASDLACVATEADAAALSASVGDWPAFADTAEALARLATRCKLIILSNVDRASFARTNPKLGVTFDAIVTAEDVGAYKPDRRMFDAARRAVAELGVAPELHLHVAQSLYHDIVPATAMGIATCWVDRRAGKPGGATKAPVDDVRPTFAVGSLKELADQFGE